MRANRWAKIVAASLTLCAVGGPALAGAPAAANGADTAWLLTSTALVLFMTLPGLALFYGGLVRSKNLLSVMAQCVAIACLASVLWLLVGYSLAFSGTGALIGDFAKAGLLSMSRTALHGTIPESAFFMFQGAFAIITPALIVGAYVERVRFPAVLLFSGLWLLVVYVPVTHWVWGGGWLAQRGVMDYAGGLVVHATAGVSALLAAAAFVAVQGALNWLVDNYPRAAEWLSSAHRVGTLLGSLETLAEREAAETARRRTP